MSDETRAPCRGCGVATDDRLEWYAPTIGGVRGRPYQRGVCDDCASLDFTRAGVAVRAALRLIDRPETDDTVAALVWDQADFDPTPVLYGRAEPQRKPWSHVDRDVKNAIKQNYVEVLYAKVHEAATENRPLPPAAEYPQGCLACGVGASMAWTRPIVWHLGPRTHKGVLCQPCAAALDRVGGLGDRMLAMAFSAAHGQTYTDDVTYPGLRPWAALDLPPQDAPFAWIELIEPVPEPDPIVELQAAVLDLRRELADLKIALTGGL